jgi:DNA-binding transcriptional LysR family regulator
VLREPGSGTRSEFEQAVARFGVAPDDLKIVLELPSNEAVLAAAAAGSLIAAVSELAAGPMIAAGRVCRLPFDLPRRSFERLTHRERRQSNAATAFVASFEAAARRGERQFDVGL